MAIDVQRVRVLVADDDREVREALVGLIATESSLDLVAQAGDAEEAVELARRLRPDVALLDVRMPGGGGPHATRAIRSDNPRTQVVALSAHDDREAVLEMIRAGAVGYLVKGLPGEELLTAIHRSARGETSLSARVAGELIDELASRLEDEGRGYAFHRAQLERIRGVLLNNSIRMVFQPIVDLSTGQVMGFEALSRFVEEPNRTPDLWFAEAQNVGLGVQLELVAVRAAIKWFDHLPGHSYMSVNVSPATALSPHFLPALGEVDLKRVIVEITEHAPVADYDVLADALGPLRNSGVRLAVDDAGSGFASLRHILRLSPDVIKLDRALTSEVDNDPAREALAAALIVFAERIGSTVVAEGIEREAELLTLRSLGVAYGQGYFLARPEPLPVGPGEVPRLLQVPPVHTSSTA
jgi:EAL domain-containing protein (putative c-di-GMP-specific phosphodiesterase class I)/DNA-binding NarL/FixJ family response regulator